MIKSLTIIFPLYNESGRLKYCFDDIEKFNIKKKIKSLEYIFVDDGSTDGSSQIIKKFINKKKKEKKNIKYKLLKISKNKGKGNALSKGVKAASKNWILTIDTDISVSISELNNWFKKKNIKFYNNIFFGSRNLKKSIVKFEYHRKLIGIVFIFLTKFFFNIKLNDTQCGFKLYPKKVAKKIFNSLTDKGFAHDIEIVLLAKKYNVEISEMPVTWVHKNNSKINFLKDSLNIFFSLKKIKEKFNH